MTPYASSILQQPPAAGMLLIVLCQIVGCNADRATHSRPPGPFLNYTTHMDGPHTFMAGAHERCRVDVSNQALIMSPVAGEDCVYVSPTIASPTPFSEAVLSWNVNAPPGTGVAIEFRAAADHQQPWTKWLYLGDWGDIPDDVENIIDDKRGWVDIDYFVSANRFRLAQFRLRAFNVNEQVNELHVRRIAVTLSDTHTKVAADELFSEEHAAAIGSIDVPYRSQKVEHPSIAGRICSPTSVTMVMSYRGVTYPTADVAARCFDQTHDIYGNWPRCVQGAHSFGVPGYLTRFSNWNQVKTMIAHGQPIIISIKAKQGQLNNAPYTRTAGHLLVITGFDENGDVTVNDPAAKDAESGQLVYKREELTTVWLGHGGTAYILLPANPK